MHEDDSGPVPFQHHRRSTDNRKRLVSWIPGISAGTLLIAIELAAGGAGAFWAIAADRQHTADLISHLQENVESNRVYVRENVTTMTNKLDKVQDSLNALTIDVAVIKGRAK